VNEEWKIDMKAVAGQFGGGMDMELDTDKATGTGKLLKVYQKDGKQFGEIQVKLDMPIKSVGKGAQSIKPEAGSKLSLDGTMDVCIDGTAATGTLKAKMKMNITAMPPMVSVMVNVDVDSVTSQKDLKK